MLWIFKVARWTCDRWPKINKSRTVTLLAMVLELHPLRFELEIGSVAYHGHSNKLMELHLWRFKLEILQSQLPRRHPKSKTQDSDANISDLGILFSHASFIFEWKKKRKKPSLDIYTRTLYSQTGNNMKCAEAFIWCLLLIFKVVYQDHLTQLLPFTRDFLAKGQTNRKHME